jgi:CheY-like chemotaxis protein
METAQATALPEEASTAESAHSYRVLVVDDNETCAKVMMWGLEALGHTAKMATDGQTAIALATSFIPDAVLLDIGLPGMNGYEICQAMRKEPSLSHTLFIAQTGWSQREHKERSKEAGFDYHLVKPIDIETLQYVLGLLDKARIESTG